MKKTLLIDLQKTTANDYLEGVRDGYEEGLADAPNKGASSWDDLTDKPFYEKSETVTEKMTVEWDGVIGDRTFFDIALGSGFCIVHMSDAVPPNIESVIGATLTMTESGKEPTSFTFTGNFAPQQINESFISLSELGFFALEDGATYPGGVLEGLVIPKKGLYVLFNTAAEGLVHYAYTGVLTATKTEVKTLDHKYLPYGSAEYEEEYSETVTQKMTIVWDGVVGDRFNFKLNAGDDVYLVHISDAVIPNLDALKAASITARAGEQEMTVSGSDDVSSVDENGIIMFGDAMVVSVPADGLRMFNIDVDLKKGLYVPHSASRGLYVSNYTGVLSSTITDTRTVIKPIDEKYLPDTIAPKELILTSSTEGSKKQFKIAVADDGTITAVAI